MVSERVHAGGIVKKGSLRGGINSRPYEQKRLITHKAGHSTKGSTLMGSDASQNLKKLDFLTE